MADNHLYYRRRIEEELAAADSATDLGISRIHQEMAQLYRDLIEDGGVTDAGHAVRGLERGAVFG